MFGFDIDKLLVIAVVALVVIGPKDLPGTLGQFGRTLVERLAKLVRVSVATVARWQQSRIGTPEKLTSAFR